MWLILLGGGAGGGLCAAAAMAADWKPDKHIELIVPTGPGSGVDNTARTLQAILQAKKLIEAPIAVTNKPGGSYGVALAYLSQFPGDAHRVMIQTSTPLTAYATGQIKVNYFEFTPIANLISEPIAFMVRAESPIKGGRELAGRIKADPAALSIALAAARGNAYHIASALIARAVGADIKKLKIVVFNSSGEAMAALLGGALAQVPTFKEQGLDVVFDVPRGFIGPKGLSVDHIRYWDGVFQRLVKTEEWRQALEKNQWVEDYRGSADMGKDLKAQYEILKDVLSELGMVK